MKALEEKIARDGKVLKGDVLKVDNFINHQIDIKFMKEIGKEFKRLFKDETVTKILTVEASGIAISSIAATYFDDCPIVFAKKIVASNMDENKYSEKLYSYTRKREFKITVAKEYLTKEDKVLILDDFLANGEALNALISVCKQAQCELVGCGIVVEKAYQPGGDRIRSTGVRVESLARVKSMSDDGTIEFCD